ncbi:MAG: hypothetical protein KTR21_14785 [Rhodobacteraceae bacterium]|nr:hypothetical protein [Paracoccaceae bacterium]
MVSVRGLTFRAAIALSAVACAPYQGQPGAAPIEPGLSEVYGSMRDRVVAQWIAGRCREPDFSEEGV